VRTCYARKHGLRVVFFSDLGRMFTRVGTSWNELGVDYERALGELHGEWLPAMLLTITERMCLPICDPVVPLSTVTHAETGETPPSDCELARQAITRQLASDWPAHIQRLLDTGRISLTR
jgi:hypothetical protein